MSFRADLGDVHLIRPVDVDAVQAVADLVSPHSGRHVVVAVKHDGQRHDEVHGDHSHRVGDEGAVEQRHS